MTFEFLSLQMTDLKKLADDRSALLEEAEQSKKKMSRDIETLQGRVDELSANNSKLEKTRKRLQDEVYLESICVHVIRCCLGLSQRQSWKIVTCFILRFIFVNKNVIFLYINEQLNVILGFIALFKQVDDVQLNLEKERAQVSALEKKQRKFDQVCESVVNYCCESILLSMAGLLTACFLFSVASRGKSHLREERHGKGQR